jgi:hypothetical protein
MSPRGAVTVSVVSAHRRFPAQSVSLDARIAARETLRYLDRNGVDAEPLLLKAELSRRQLSQDSGGISVASQHLFLEFAAIERNDSLLGLHVAAEMDLRDASILFYLTAASATVALHNSKLLQEFA